MYHLLKESLAEVRERLNTGQKMSMFLDFDGTITPIVRDPEKVVLKESTRDILVDVLQSKRAAVHVISGRSLDDVISRVGVDGVTYAGNHGMEIAGRYVRFIDPTALATMDELEDITVRLRSSLQSIRGVMTEFKRLTATVHYRNVAEIDIPEVWDIVEGLVESYAPLFRLRTGAKSLDILPTTNWNKGSAARWINDCCGIPPRYSIYVGDDNTDEDAFKVLSEGITIRVGDVAHSAATFQLNDSTEVVEFLKWFAHRKID